MCHFKSKVIHDKDDDFEDIMIMALRYALGRRTYVTSEICTFISQNLGHIDERIKHVMIKDIKEYLEKKNKGIISDDLCDETNFNNLLYILENKVGDNSGEEDA
jgi:hypothetical protein